MKKHKRNSFEPVTEQGYKKGYLMRKIQEDEAETEIEEFSYDQPTAPQPEAMSRPPNVDA